MKLYDAAFSGNCHKVRMMLSILGLDYDQVPVDLKAGAQRRPEFLALNPLGKIPVLEDEDLVIRDSQAILVYLAGKHGSPDWWPEDAPGQGQIMQWLAFSVNEMFHGPAIARGLVLSPPIVLADEPTGNLDPHTAEAVEEILLSLNREVGTALVLVTHNEKLASRLAKKCYLVEGRLAS